MSYWSDPKVRKICIIDAVGIAIISALAGGFFGILIGIAVAG